MKTLILLAVFIFLPIKSIASGWSCSNDSEVMCSDKGCSISTGDDFTRMDIILLDNGKMTICAYTGCWEGVGKVTHNNSFISFYGERFIFSTSPNNKEMQEDIAVTIDKRDNIGILKNSIFAQPILCNRFPKKSSAKTKPPK